jgi:hypothetical protein
MYTPTSISIRSCWKKSPVNSRIEQIDGAAPRGRLLFCARDHSYCDLRHQKVFNTFVEISVEKGDSIFVTDSARNASALCTEAGAGTFWVEPLGTPLTTEAQRQGESSSSICSAPDPSGYLPLFRRTTKGAKTHKGSRALKLHVTSCPLWLRGFRKPSGFCDVFASPYLRVSVVIFFTALT